MRIPVLVDISKTEIYDAAMEKAAKQFLTDVDKGSMRVEDLISEGRIIFIFENVALDEQKIKRLSHYMMDHRDNRFVVFIRAEIWDQTLSPSFNQELNLAYLIAQPLSSPRSESDSREISAQIKPDNRSPSRRYLWEIGLCWYRSISMDCRRIPVRRRDSERFFSNQFGVCY